MIFFFLYSSFSLPFALSFVFLYTSMSRLFYVDNQLARECRGTTLRSIRELLCLARCRTLQVYEYGSRRALVALVYIFARSCNVCRTNFSEKGKHGNDSSFRIVSDSAISAEPRRSRELSRNDRNSALSILRDFN